MNKKIMSEDDAAIMEEMQHTTAAPEPGMKGLKENIQDSGRDMPIDGKPKIKWIGSAGYVYVWDNRTGDRSIINQNMLKTQLEKRRPEDGSRAFTTVDPKITIKQGALKCMLHSDERKPAYFRPAGLPIPP